MVFCPIKKKFRNLIQDLSKMSHIEYKSILVKPFLRFFNESANQNCPLWPCFLSYQNKMREETCIHVDASCKIWPSSSANQKQESSMVALFFFRLNEQNLENIVPFHQGIRNHSKKFNKNRMKNKKMFPYNVKFNFFDPFHIVKHFLILKVCAKYQEGNLHGCWEKLYRNL